MNYIKHFIVMLSFSLLFISCSEDNPAGTDNNNSGSGNITITVSSGATPQYSWSGGNVFSVTVVRTSAPSVPVWGIVTAGQDNIASPATHGAMPAGAIQTFAVETTLTSGVEYRVTVARISGEDFGFTDFRP